MKAKPLIVPIPETAKDQRLDHALAVLLDGRTRSQIQQWIENGHVQLNGRPVKKNARLKGGETVQVQVPAPKASKDKAQAIKLDVLYEDKEILVLNKPAGLVVHPGAGNATGTLLNALLHHAPSLRKLPRAGIVHRLDKDTSGLLVVAKTEKARQHLIEQLATRSMSREYVAIVGGILISGTTVEAPIGRHRGDRLKMAVMDSGKEAISHVRVLKKYRSHTLVQVALESGRTHQIRVHLAHIKYPIVGDPLYGGRLKFPKAASADLREALSGFQRQALHAIKLKLVHPKTEKEMQWTASVPKDMGELMEVLAEDAKGVK